MTYETIMNTIAIVGVAPLVLCLLYAMIANISLIGNPTVWYSAIVVWGLIISPIVFATGWLIGVSLAYWSVLLGLYLTGMLV